MRVEQSCFPLVELSKLVKINIGKTPARKTLEYWGKGHTWVSIADLNGKKHIDSSKEQITDLGVKESKIKIVPKNTLLFSYKLSIGKVAITEKALYTNEAIASFPILDPQVLDLKYFYYVMREFNFTDSGDRAVMGKTLNKKKLEKLKIPLPRLNIQKRIVEVLDAAAELKQKDNALIAKYNELSQSLFLDMFGDPSNNQNEFPLGKIEDLVSEVKYGTSAKAVEGGHYPYLRMNNITYEGYMDYGDLKYIDLVEKDKPKYLVKKGDLLFNRTNSKELVGKTGIYDQDTEMVIAGYLIRVRVNEIANPYYIWGYLNSQHGKLTLNNMCKNIVGMANINAKELQNIKILIPPIDLQNKFAEHIQSIEKQKQQAQASLKKSEELFNCLMQKAFKGELVA